MDGNAAPALWRRLRAFALIASLGVSACGATPSIDPGRVLHLQSRVSQALLVEVASQATGQRYVTSLRPCGSEVSLTAGREYPDARDVVVTLYYDPSGAFDEALAAWRGDAHDMALPHFQPVFLPPVRDVWSSELPKWLVVTWIKPTLLDSAPTGPTPAHCHSVPGEPDTAANP